MTRRELVATMGLDDFIKDDSDSCETGSVSDDEADLSNNTPPSDASKWRFHEPGNPGWLSLITGTEMKDPSAIDQDQGMIIKIDGVSNTRIISSEYVDLSKKQ